MFDLSFFVVVTTIALNIVLGIIIDTFSQLREAKVNELSIKIEVTYIFTMSYRFRFKLRKTWSQLASFVIIRAISLTTMGTALTHMLKRNTTCGPICSFSSISLRLLRTISLQYSCMSITRYLSWLHSYFWPLLMHVQFSKDRFLFAVKKGQFSLFSIGTSTSAKAVGRGCNRQPSGTHFAATKWNLS